MNTSMLRTRWAAIGAAVAVTLGAGGLATTYATNPAGAVAFVPITACRLADTRPAPDNVGPRSTPIGAGETVTISAHGDNGNCTGIPSSATGLSLNVTAIGATSGTFLTIWANGAPQPLASSLNPQPGAPPIPNAVTTGLSAGGQFDIFNGLGSVNVIVDVVGYYTDHTHSSADITNEAGVAFTSTESGVVNAVTTEEVVATVSIRPPSTGYVTVHASGTWYSTTAERQLVCQITDGTSVIANGATILIDTLAVANLAQGFALEQTFAVPQYTGLFITGQPFNLVCRVSGAGGGFVRDLQMTATFFPTSYAPGNIIIAPFGTEAMPAGTPDGMGGVTGD